MTAASRVTGHVLLAEGKAPLAALLAQHVTALGHRVTSVSTGAAVMSALLAEPFDVALLDLGMPSPDALEVLRSLGDEPDPPAIIITTASATIDTAVQAMRLGAFAYLAKPYRMAELDVLLERALSHRVLAHENAALRFQVARAEGAPELLTQYAPLAAVFALAMATAASDTPVLIVGAPGSGKCALARVIHGRSPRAQRPFVALSGETLARPDAERSLFGGDRTAARGAGRAALASGGTLYLMDVFALPLRTQARLAMAIRDGRFTTAAGEERTVRARVLAGTSEHVERIASRAHPALLDALSAARVELPPLRERAVDIPLLAAAFIASAGDAASPRLDAVALDALQRYDWPGNVAELRAVVERGRLRARDGVIHAADLSLDVAVDDLALAEVERRHIVSVLSARGWHQGHAAKALGISPKTLYRKIREFGLLRPTSKPRG